MSSQGGGGNSGPMSPSKPLQNATTPTANLAKKFKLAEFRYGKEELLQLFVNNPERPADMPMVPPICVTQPSPPLAFVPLTDDEQVGQIVKCRYSVSFYPTGVVVYMLFCSTFGGTILMFFNFVAGHIRWC